MKVFVSLSVSLALVALAPPVQAQEVAASDPVGWTLEYVACARNAGTNPVYHQQCLLQFAVAHLTRELAVPLAQAVLEATICPPQEHEDPPLPCSLVDWDD